MNADSKDDALVGRETGVAVDHRALDLDRRADRVDHAPGLDDGSVAGALDDAAVMERDGRVDEVAAQRAQARKRSLLASAPASFEKPTTSAARVVVSLRSISAEDKAHPPLGRNAYHGRTVNETAPATARERRKRDEAWSPMAPVRRLLRERPRRMVREAASFPRFGRMIRSGGGLRELRQSASGTPAPPGIWSAPRRAGPRGGEGSAPYARVGRDEGQ